MNKKIITLTIVLSLLILGFLSTAQPIHYGRLDLNQGKFEAQIGFGRNDRSHSNLDGYYNIRGGLRIVRGIYTSNEIEGRFQGTFIRNLFFMEITTPDGTQTIYGRIRIADDYSTFTGFWNTRGIDNKGWISGEFITRK